MRTIRQTTFAVRMATPVSAQDAHFDQQADSLRFHIPGSLEIDDLLAKDVQQAFDAALAKRVSPMWKEILPISISASRYRQIARKNLTAGAGR